MNITICDRCNAQLQIPLIDEINLRQHQQSKSCKAVAAKVKASASQPKITSLLRHVFASPAASDATAAAVQPVTPIFLPSCLHARCPTDQQRKDQMPIHVLTDQYRVQPVLYLMYLMRMSGATTAWLDHMQIAHSSQQVSVEQINKFAISKDEYVGVLGKELTAKKLKEEFLLLKTDMLMEPRISLFWSKLMREEWE